MKRRRRLRELSAYGFDEMAKQTCFGVRFHLSAYRPGLGQRHELLPLRMAELLAD
jgi:hypothetical protein